MKTEKNILIAFILNISFSILEIFGGIITGSIAIISDAIHDFCDALSIGISYLLERKSKKQPDNKYTFGYTRYSVLGAIITNTILIIASLIVIYNGIFRIINPVEINYDGMIVFAVLGILINLLASHITKMGKSLNQKAVNLHMLEDVLGWFVVLIGAIIIRFTNINVIDSILSICVAIFILIHALSSYKEIIDLFLEKTPDKFKIEEIKEHILKIEGIKDIHHIHIWSMDQINNYATMHIVTNSNDIENLKKEIKEELKEHDINHTTIEIEKETEKCMDTKCHIDTESNNINNHHHH